MHNKNGVLDTSLYDTTLRIKKVLYLAGTILIDLMKSCYSLKL